MKWYFWMLITTTISTLSYGGLSEAAFSVRVVGEDGSPISNALVLAGFYGPPKRGSGQSDVVNERFKVTTDTNGTVSLKGRTHGTVRWGVNKDGYYSVLGMMCTFTNVVSGKLEPWDALYEVVLKEMVNPISMYARHLDTAWPEVKVPVLGENVGFDLLESDWLAPHGMGKIGDLIIHLDVEEAKMPEGYYEQYPHSVRHKNLTLTVQFSNPDDGLLPILVQPNKGSVLRLPRLAPESGYQTTMVKRAWVEPENILEMYREDQNYIYRVRTKRDTEGNLEGGLYGKIHGPIQCSPNGTIKFTYYLNPTPGDRNLEFDPTKNLFTDLPKIQKPGDP